MGLAISIVQGLQAHALLRKMDDAESNARRIELTWFLSGYAFLATFSTVENIMTVHLISNNEIVDEIDVVFDRKAQVDALYRDLQLRKVSLCLIDQAISIARIESVYVH